MAETEMEMVRRHVHDAERLVEEQRMRMEYAVTVGDNADLAMALLQSLERRLTLHRAHLQQLLERHADQHTVDRRV